MEVYFQEHWWEIIIAVAFVAWGCWALCKDQNKGGGSGGSSSGGSSSSSSSSSNSDSTSA